MATFASALTDRCNERMFASNHSHVSHYYPGAPMTRTTAAEAYLLDTSASEDLAVRFHGSRGGVEQLVRTRASSEIRSTYTHNRAHAGWVAPAIAEQGWLAQTKVPDLSGVRGTVRTVDLFSGCGGLSLGVAEASRALRLEVDCRLAVDLDPAAAAVFEANFPGVHVHVGDVGELFEGELGERLTLDERRVRSRVGVVDLLAGGPPCQGHSDFNNRTRRRDRKNALYLKMVRAAEVLQPQWLMIENVPGALNDRGRVVQRAVDHLQRIGYAVDVDIVDSSLLGVAQKRRRLVLLASLGEAPPSVLNFVDSHRVPPRSVKWAIGDLVDVERGSLLDTPAASAPATRDRIAYLFRNNLYELPNSERPPCHSKGDHTYSSVYGRLRWDQPSQTVTTGFYSMCMGRYVHPSKPRTLTAHEAARLQHFPDWFDFTPATKRSDLSRMIGNAVPSKVSYALVLEMLR